MKAGYSVSLCLLFALAISAAGTDLSIDKSSSEGAMQANDPAGIYHAIFSAQKIDDQHQAYIRNDPSATIAYYSNRTREGDSWVFAGPERREGRTYTWLGDPVFSQDGHHIAYAARKADSNSMLAVVDGDEGQEYDRIYKIVFSADGGRYAYMADKGNQVVMVVDGQEEGPYDSISGDPVVSSGGQHVLYTITKESTNYVVVDGEVQKHVGYDPVVSPEGSRWAYSRSAVYAGDPCYIVLDGEVMDLGKDNGVGQKVFSPDGRHFAYDFIPNFGAYADHVVVVDGAPGKAYPSPGIGKIIFSPDGGHVAYWASDGSNGFFMVLDGVEGKSYRELSDPIFSPDGRHMAYVATDERGKIAVLDGTEGKSYLDVGRLTFGADGRLAYVARDSRDGQEVRLVVADGLEGRPFVYDWSGQGILSGPVFSPDGSHFVYMANDGGRAEFLVVDGHMQMSPWLRLYESPIIFDSMDEFHYLGFNSSGTYLIKGKIEPLQEQQGCGWTGIWEFDWGIMSLEQIGSSVTGVFWGEWGLIDGTAAGDVLAGRWSRFPEEGGEFEIVMFRDCRNFTGNWSRGSGETGTGRWTGKRY
jgi:hypothetical protein